MGPHFFPSLKRLTRYPRDGDGVDICDAENQFMAAMGQLPQELSKRLPDILQEINNILPGEFQDIDSRADATFKYFCLHLLYWTKYAQKVCLIFALEWNLFLIVLMDMELHKMHLLMIYSMKDDIMPIHYRDYQEHQ